MTPDRKVLKKVQQTAAAVLEKADGPVKQGKLVSKVFKKVHSKYADVTEQRVETLVQQLLQENSGFRLHGNKVVLSAAVAPPTAVPAAPTAVPAAAGANPAAVQHAAADVQQQGQAPKQQQQQEDKGKKKHKKKRKAAETEQQQQQQLDGAAVAAAADRAKVGHEQEHKRKKHKHKSDTDKQEAAAVAQEQHQQEQEQQQQQQEVEQQHPAAAAVTAGARITRLGAPAAETAPVAVPTAQPTTQEAAETAAAAKGVAAKFAKQLKTTNTAAGANGSSTSKAKPQPRKRKAAAAAAAAGDGGNAAGGSAAAKSPQPRKRKAKSTAAAAAAGGGAAAAAAVGSGSGGSDPLAGVGDGETWREDFNRKDLKHGPYEPDEVAEVQEYVTSFASARGLPDQPGTCDWLLDLKGNNITKNMLTEAIYKPCLPHRACKSVWQYVHRVFPPYKWGPWTDEEDSQLSSLQAAKGNRWKEIGLVLGRHSESVADRWKNLNSGNERKTGRWSKEEEEKLTSLVTAFKSSLSQVDVPRTLSESQLPSATDEPRLLGTVPKDDIDWTWVAGRMGTRTSKQCADKWHTSLGPTLVERGEWAPGNDKVLVEGLVRGLQAGPEWEIDWAALVPGQTVQQCKRRWRAIQQHLPVEQRRTFTASVAAAAKRFKLTPPPASAAKAKKQKPTKAAAQTA